MRCWLQRRIHCRQALEQRRQKAQMQFPRMQQGVRPEEATAGTLHINAVHENVRHGPCPCCNLTFSSKQKLKLHLRQQRMLLADAIGTLD